jgi:arylsulfatase A-like enzyme
MKRRDFIRGTVAGSLLSLLPRAGVFAEGPSPTTRPNVLFLFSDQHNAAVTSYAGHPDVRTPALDKLAGEGMRFERAYCPDGICCPSRTAMLSGNYPRTFGVYEGHLGNYQGHPYESETAVTASLTPIQSVFKRAGYYTMALGKRHVMPHIDADWDYAATHLLEKQWPSEYNRGGSGYWDWIQQQGLMSRLQSDWGAEFGGKNAAPLACRQSLLPPEATMEAFTAQRTIDFLQSPQARKQPFFAWSTFYRPHQPYTPLKKYIDQIDFNALRMPETLWQNRDDLPPALDRMRQSTHKPWDMGEANDAAYRLYLGYYLALVQEIDDHIHNILDVLDKQGLAENTIVIYSSDHGDFVGNHGLVEKMTGGHNFYEDTLRIPLIFRWPGRIPAGMVRQDLVEIVDLYPTLLGLCGLDAPKNHPLVGKNLADTLLRQSPVDRKYVVSENWFQATVITGNFKYGQWLNSLHPRQGFASWGNMLMERSSDPHEVKNLIANPAHAATQKELQGYLMEWVGNTDDSGRREAFAKDDVPYAAV